MNLIIKGYGKKDPPPGPQVLKIYVGSNRVKALQKVTAQVPIAQRAAKLYATKVEAQSRRLGIKNRPSKRNRIRALV